MSEQKGVFCDARPVEKFTTKAGKEYTKRLFKIHYDNASYRKEAWFELFGEKVQLLDKIEIGALVTVSFDPTSKEWDGKIFTENKAWNVTSF